jgi:hypothetical protein
MKPAVPSKPVPNSISEPGSGTVVPPVQFASENPVMPPLLPVFLTKPVQTLER